MASESEIAVTESDSAPKPSGSDSDSDSFESNDETESPLAKCDSEASENNNETESPPTKRRLNSKDIRKQWNMVKLFERTRDETLAIKFAEELGLLPTEKKCRVHRRPMTTYARDNAIGLFQCNKRTCKGKRTVSRALGTWFDQARIPVSRVFYLMYCFARKFPYEMVQIEDYTSPSSCVSTKTIADWYSYCREVIVDHFVDNCDHVEKIGGPGRVVQIDESKFERRKSNKSRRVDGHWVLGMIEEGSEDVRLEVCSESIESPGVLIPLIQKRVKPGTTIHTDCWKAYDCLSQNGFIHKTVNQSDPDKPYVAEDGVDPQRMQSQWRVVRRSFHGDSYSRNFSDWIVEYQWRRNIKKKHQDPFEELVKGIVHLYGNFKS